MKIYCYINFIFAKCKQYPPYYAVIDLKLLSGNGSDDGSLPRLQFWFAMFGRGRLQEKAQLPAFDRKSAASPPMCFLKNYENITGIS